MKIIPMKLPDGFVRYPCPASESILEGTVEVPLGSWNVDGNEREFHLRIYFRELPKLIEKIQKSTSSSVLLGFGSFSVFKVAMKGTVRSK